MGVLSGAPDDMPAGGFVRWGGSDLGSPEGARGGLGGSSGRIFAFELLCSAEVTRCPTRSGHRADTGDGIALAVGAGVLGRHKKSAHGEERV